MINKIPAEVINICKKITDKGFKTYLVGGSVRDLILERGVKDWDITTEAKPEEIVKLFEEAFYDNEFGTVGIPAEIEGKDHVIEITTFRTEVSFSPSHKPEKISWGKTIEEDLSRRDFTINAIALSIGFKDGKTEEKIIDPYKGKEDIENKILKAVGDPNLRFKEDALRLLRAIRIATELQFKIEEKTWKKIKEDANLITHISGERIKTELLRILGNKNAYEGVLLLKDSGLLAIIIPELMEGVGVSQARPGRHHTEDVFTHNILSLKYCPSDKSLVKFAALLHDVGKPRVASKDNEGLVIFHNHEVVGAKMAKEISERLRFSNKEKEKVETLIRWHMFSVNENQTDSAIRRFIRKVGVENVEDMMDLRIGDRLGGGTQTAESWRLKLFRKKVEEQLKPAPYSINDMAINGNDIMKELNIKPGPLIGKILNELFEETDEDLSKNKREYLLNRAKTLYEVSK